MGLYGKVLVVGAAGMVSLTGCQRLPQCLRELMPASSKTDSSLAKAKPISDGGITDLRRGEKKKPLCGSNQREGVRTCERINTGDIKAGKEEGWGCVASTQAGIPLQAMVRQLCLCSPWSPWGSKYYHQPMDHNAHPGAACS